MEEIYERNRESQNINPIQHVDYGWNGPRCLLENLSGQEMKINEETMQLVREIHHPMVVVSIVGLYRTGKSYLMNKLAGKQSGFELGNTIQAMTKGIWVWCIPHPLKTDTCLMLMDTEGLGDVEKGDSQNDVMLFTIAALLSSTLVYNSKGTIDQQAMDNIHCITRIAEKLKISEDTESSEEEDVQLAEHFPGFVWTVRDFNLELKINGNSVTADEYLENSLALKKGAGKKAMEHNLPRKCIRRYFPQRKCFVFPPPAGPEDMLRLDQLSESQLIPSFRACSEEFCSYIFESSHPKSIRGHVLNGQKFAGMTIQYIDQISKGKIPSIENAIVSMAKHVNEEALSECVKQYKAKMEAIELPVDNDNLLIHHHQQCEEAVRKLFFQLAMVIDDHTKIASQFTDFIGDEFKNICKRNDELSVDISKRVLEGLLKVIQVRIDSGYYYKIGGYTEYQQNIAKMVKSYHDIPGKGVQSHVVLDDFVKRQRTTAKAIMAFDKNVSDMQQQAEEKRLELEQMQQEMLKWQQETERTKFQFQEHLKSQEEFMKSMEAKFQQELEAYKTQITQLQKQVDKERQILQKENEYEDAEELSKYFDALQVKQQKQNPLKSWFSRH